MGGVLKAARRTAIWIVCLCSVVATSGAGVRTATLASSAAATPGPATVPSRPSPSGPSSSGAPSVAPPTLPWPTATGQGPWRQPPYLTRNSDAWNAYQAAVDPVTRRLLYQIAATPTSIWLGGSPTDGEAVNKIETEAANSGQTPQFVLYAIPQRDCGGHWAGGVADVTSYERWIDSVRAGIAQRPTIVIVEPDAVGMTCLSDSDRADRIHMLDYAIDTLSRDPHTWVYLHAGSSKLRPTDVLPQLLAVNIQKARGFAINVSSYGSTAAEMRYGDSLVEALAAQGVAGQHYVIDTSRNGLGRAAADSEQGIHGSCNQRGRALGSRPTPQTGNPNVDALLWVKPPGESDGACFAGDPPTGWYQSYALDLVRQSLSHHTVSELTLPR